MVGVLIRCRPQEAPAGSMHIYFARFISCNEMYTTRDGSKARLSKLTVRYRYNTAVILVIPVVVARARTLFIL